MDLRPDLYEIYNPNFGQIKIQPSEAVAKGLFLKNPDNSDSYLAHPVTIKALKKNIFTTDANMDDTSGEISCRGCENSVDPQFWHHCPICETPFK